MMSRWALHAESSLLSTLGGSRHLFNSAPVKASPTVQEEISSGGPSVNRGPATSGSTCTLLGAIVHRPNFCGRHNSVRHSTWRAPVLRLHSAPILGPLSRGSIWHMEA